MIAYDFINADFNQIHSTLLDIHQAYIRLCGEALTSIHCMDSFTKL